MMMNTITTTTTTINTTVLNDITNENNNNRINKEGEARRGGTDKQKMKVNDTLSKEKPNTNITTLVGAVRVVVGKENHHEQPLRLHNNNLLLSLFDVI